ncbi:MAG: hypothetical protein LBQ51_01400 [Desulfovibrio sp.]|jgi:CRISPR-associated protein Csm4|nr:hypothetical protein [Desulfovibrio sp.]
MRTYRLVLRPETAFGARLVGDTLFGQLCRILRRLRGETALNELLEDYTKNRPFAVLSDAVPHGFVPLPALPSFFWTLSGDEDRKKRKSKRWVGVEHLTDKLIRWQSCARDDEDAYAAHIAQKDKNTDDNDIRCAPETRVQQHNTINRMTGSTGTGNFAPYGMTQFWHHPETALDLYAVLDESRLDKTGFMEALSAVGKLGYGRDAGIGLGKFVLEGDMETPAWDCRPAKSFLTLALCAPQGLNFDAKHSFYRVRVHFGRHGEEAALGPNPFKHPLLAAETGAVFTLPEAASRQFLGQGVTGISKADARTVHQGYAPAVPLPDLPEQW